jgi:cellulose synthase/poly-beta-1,6-N-acetylglucosamine synthase-like glycosyltransferase
MTVIYLLGGICLLLLILPALYVAILSLAGPARSATSSAPPLPPLTVLIPAHNEAINLPAKIEGVFSQDYPPGLLQLIVIDDGSTDGTSETLSRFSGRIRTLRLTEARGKIAALNLGLGEAATDVVAITDADTELEPGALRALAVAFADESVGAVSGRLMVKGEGRTARWERSYAEAEDSFRGRENRFSSVPFLFGQLSAFRRSVLPRIPEAAAVDDLEIALAIREKSFRVISSEGAIVCEVPPPALGGLLRQKVRRGLCTIEVVLRHLSLLDPRRQGRFALTFFVRRVLPLFSPALLSVLFVCLWAASGHWYVPAAIFGVLGILAWLKNPPFTEYMVMMQGTICLSWWMYLTRRIPEGANWKSRPERRGKCSS